MKKIFIKTFVLMGMLFSIMSCSGSSGEKGDSSSLSLDDLVPSQIDNSVIDNIAGFESLKKTKVETEENIKYESSQELSDEQKNKIIGFGETIRNLGELKVVGDSFSDNVYDGSYAVGNTGSFLGITYCQNVEKEYKFGDEKCNIFDSQIKLIDGFSVETPVHSGAFVLLKSSDGEKWEREIYSTNINRKSVFYTPNSDDVIRGTYYKLINLVEFRWMDGYRTETTGALWWKTTHEVPNYVNFTYKEEFVIYMCNTFPNLKFECGRTSSITFDENEYTKEEISLLQKSTTMTDGSVSTTYIDVIPMSNYVTYRYNYTGPSSTKSETLKEAKRFDKPGKYEFETTDKLGNIQRNTLFIFDLKDDNGFSQLFGEGVCDKSKRMFDLTKSVPVYLINKDINVKAIDSFCPARFGTIAYFKDENAIANNDFEILKSFNGDRNSYSTTLNRQGYYVMNFQNCDLSTTSGDILQYTFILYISSNIYYAPSVNYTMLKDFSRINQLLTKAFGVSLLTTGGGSYQFIFPYSQDFLEEAYNLAVDIEELSVEIVDHNGTKNYFYKSLDNPYIKTNYVSKLALYEAINKYADMNLSVIYLENDIDFATSIIEPDDLSDLSKRTIKNTVRVISNENVLQAMQTGDVYLNNFKFTQVANYEVDSVKATKSNGQEVAIPFDTNIDAIFNENEKLEITESNWNGNKKYNAIYSQNNACEIKAICNGSIRGFNYLNNGESFSFKTFSFVSVSDEFDNQTLVAVNNGKTRDLFSMKEIEGLSLPKGKYEITFINRNNQTFAFKIECTNELSSEVQSTDNFDHDPLRVRVPTRTDGNIEDVSTTKISQKIIYILLLFVVAIVSSSVSIGGTYYFLKKKNAKGGKNNEK